MIATQFRTRADLARDVPPGGIMIELGVARGDFAVELILANREANYIGIDRYSDHHGEAEYVFAFRKISYLGHILHRNSFDREVEMHADESASLVYVDGYAHTGQEGGQTLRDWWPKVKTGGIFAGHDYHPTYQSTIDAVDSFVADHGLTLNIIEEEPFPSWWVRKPE